LDDGPIYLDYNATTPVDARVVEAMRPYWTEHFGNPSSGHHYAKRPMQALVTAREQVANLIGARAGHIVFTASGSEANLLALRGMLVSSSRPRPHVITQATEHPAVLETCRALERLQGVRVTVLPVERSGVLDAHRLEMAMTADTILVSVMAANNETGTLQPVAELASITHRHGARFHCDAAQACAKIPVDVSGWGVDLLTVVGHKMYAPKGIGALYVGPGLRLEPAIYGGGQEHGLRAGTENVALAVALGAAADLADEELCGGQPPYLAALRDDLHQRLKQALAGRIHLNGHPTARLPNTLNVSIDGIIGNQLLDAVPEVAASTGSACHADTHLPSPVLTAMGIPADLALGALRLSLGRWSTSADIATAAEVIADAAALHSAPRHPTSLNNPRTGGLGGLDS
jgi:cysteine desulfurase